MNTWRKLWLTIIATAFVASSAHAEVTWDKVKGKITSSKDYTVTYKYDGPQGKYEFDYRFAGGGSNIRTEITKSKSDPTRKGTVIVYDKSWDADKIRAKTGGGMIVRNLTHKDVEDRPFAEGIFQMILRQVGSETPSAKAEGSNTRFQFKSGYEIVANGKGEIVETRRKHKKVDESRWFDNHGWNNSPKTGFQG